MCEERQLPHGLLVIEGRSVSLDNREAIGRGNGVLTGDHDLAQIDLSERAEEAAAFLKAMSHEGRLMILCHLFNGERSVTELEQMLGSRQAAVSQQLARLRLEGMVSTRRDGKTIYYSVSDERVLRILSVVHAMFCEDM
jgi:ArsR family transcriptional regulator